MKLPETELDGWISPTEPLPDVFYRKLMVHFFLQLRLDIYGLPTIDSFPEDGKWPEQLPVFLMKSIGAKKNEKGIVEKWVKKPEASTCSTIYFDKRQLRCYVAGSWDERETVATVQTYVQKNGIELTHNWAVKPPSPRNIPEHMRLDTKGVADCDFMLLVLNNAARSMKGSSFELGLAVAQKKPIFIIHWPGQREIFEASNPFTQVPEYCYWLGKDDFFHCL